MGYWDLFPAEGGWGRVPAWGFADVVASRGPLDEGARVFGLLPMSTHLVVTVARASRRGFIDSASHRTELHTAYNWYERVDEVAAKGPAGEDHHALLRPLFLLSFLAAQHLHDRDHFGATTVVLSSASSKTALGTATLLADVDAVTTIGLSSPARAPFVESLGVYDQVAAYDAVEALPDADVVYLDFAGDDATRSAVERRYGSRLAHSLLIGGTHQDQPWAGPGVAPVPGHGLFFAPAELAARIEEWGRAGFDERFGAAWNTFAALSVGWLTITHHRGPDPVRRAWTDLVAGAIDPAVGHIGTMAL